MQIILAVIDFKSILLCMIYNSNQVAESIGENILIFKVWKDTDNFVTDYPDFFYIEKLKKLIDRLESNNVFLS